MLDSELLPILKKGQVAVAIAGLRAQYWILNEGDSISLIVENAEDVLYYLNQQSDNLNVVVEETGTAEASDAESL